MAGIREVQIFCGDPKRCSQKKKQSFAFEILFSKKVEFWSFLAYPKVSMEGQ